jgi:hypothetical protein
MPEDRVHPRGRPLLVDRGGQVRVRVGWIVFEGKAT